MFYIKILFSKDNNIHEREAQQLIKNIGEIPYTAHGAQITPPPFLFLFIFVFMLILG